MQGFSEAEVRGHPGVGAARGGKDWTWAPPKPSLCPSAGPTACTGPLRWPEAGLAHGPGGPCILWQRWLLRACLWGCRHPQVSHTSPEKLPPMSGLTGASLSPSPPHTSGDPAPGWLIPHSDRTPLESPYRSSRHWHQRSRGQRRQSPAAVMSSRPRKLPRGPLPGGAPSELRPPLALASSASPVSGGLRGASNPSRGLRPLQEALETARSPVGKPRSPRRPRAAVGAAPVTCARNARPRVGRGWGGLGGRVCESTAFTAVLGTKRWSRGFSAWPGAGSGLDETGPPPAQLPVFLVWTVTSPGPLQKRPLRSLKPLEPSAFGSSLLMLSPGPVAPTPPGGMTRC